ncbi:TonB-dependent receptor [Porphyromonas crevioricanis JCM 15906]|uniref:TonB-dependent receptor n=1 Tax=Porphyromonas crevioricanis JCM 15906 TaxID=1305617 RepID=T1CI58_9PORP|nr:carboxypeptidase-like regulatory domain-containing protein [Porphyromonas crevioricanis]GAD05756.1 TonB-dependent receptor [Porphyromonas crevioricanis JCM 15906]SJZ62958.1 Carboxypeptidase regulatory-like domain-containing protein [Porphyromonas crevioricanis]
MKRSILLLIFLWSASIGVACGQMLDGGIVDSEAKPLSNVVIALYSSTDTLKQKFYTVTDSAGLFSFEKIPADEYVLCASSLGYKPYSANVLVGKQAVHLGMITMEMEWKELSTVMVTANYIQHKGEKTIYRIPTSVANRVRSAFELMRVVPELRINPSSQSIEFANGASFLILINDIPSTEAELKAIPTQDVKKIEVYDTPPARYMAYDCVINVTTFDRTQGYAVGFSADQSICPSSGYTNGFAYAVYNKGQKSVAIQYSYTRRRFTELIGKESYQFTLPSGSVDRQQDLQGTKDMHMHLPALYYIYNNPQKQILQVVIKPNFSHSYNSYMSDISLAKEAKLKGNACDRTSMIYPSVDVFQRYYFASNKYLSNNLVFTNYRVWQAYKNSEWDAMSGVRLLSNDMTQSNVKYSTILQTDFTHILDKNVYSLGMRYAGSLLNTSIKDLQSTNNYHSTQHSIDLYGDYVQQLDSWTFVGRIGLGYLYSKAYEAELSNLLPQTDLSVYYQINPHHKLVFKTAYSYNEPSLSLRTKNTRSLIQGLRYSGNPNLKGTTNATIGIHYTMSYNNFYCSLSPILTQQWSPIFSNYILNREEMLQRPENAKGQTITALRYNLRYSFFSKELLTFTINGSLSHHSLTPHSMKRITYFGTPINYQIDLNLGRFSAFYQGSLFREYMSGLTINAGDVTSNIGLRYRIKNYTFSLNGIWFLTEPEQWSRTNPTSLVQMQSKTIIQDQRTVITLGMSIDSSSGNSNMKARSLNNNDNDSGAF